MLDILIIIIFVLAIFGFFALRTGIRQRLLNELATCYNEAIQLLQSCTLERMPAELVMALNEPSKELALALQELEKAFSSETAAFRYKQILRDDKPLVEAKSQAIRDTIARWNDYAKFKQQLTDGLSDLISHNNSLIDKTHDLIRHDNSLEDIVQIRSASVLSQLEDYQNKYRELRKTPFEEFATEHQVPDLSKAFMDQVDLLINELKYFRDHLKVYITGLFRKSIYYIALEDTNNKSARRHTDTIQVSFKTFSECEKGSPYKWDIIIGGKYVSTEQNITLKSYKGDIETKITHKLTKEQFEQIFSTLTFNRKFEETDEEGIPYQINVMGLDFLILEKQANDFDVTYYSDLFEGASIYDFLSYNKYLDLTPLLTVAEETTGEAEEEVAASASDIVPAAEVIAAETEPSLSAEEQAPEQTAEVASGDAS